MNYGGTGLYFIEPCENGALHITLMPDTQFIRPHWKELHTGEPVVRLDDEAQHKFELKLPALGKRWIYRREGPRWVPVTASEGAVRFAAQPGEYLIEQEKLMIDRKLLEEGWGH